MRAELEKQLAEKEKELKRLRVKWTNAKKKGDDIAAESIANTGKIVKTDCDILQRRLRMLNMGKPEKELATEKPLANVKPLTPAIRRKRGPAKKVKPVLPPLILKPYKDD